MKINLLMKKEEIDAAKVNQSKVAVVLDILMATTAITASLSEGAKGVIPVLDETEAIMEKEKHLEEEVCLAGEQGGLAIDGFLHPLPSLLSPHVAGKQVILSTTNGTVAIRAAAQAKTTYVASLLNGKAVAQTVVNQAQDETILVICSGSSGQFCLEDFYGAGYLITQVMKKMNGKPLELTDSARSAALFYEGYAKQAEKVLRDSKVGQMLISAGFDHDIQYASQQAIIDLVPQFIENKVIVTR